MRFQNCTFVAMVIACCTLGAQEVKYGGQFTLAIPQGDIAKKEVLDGKMGWGFGVNMLIPIAEAHAIVPRIDYVMYRRSLDGPDNILKLNQWMVGGDYNYYVSGKAGQGLYLTGGLGYTRLEVAGRGLDVLGLEDLSIRHNKLYLAGGVGYAFNNHMGAECRYTHVNYRAYDTSMTGPAIYLSFVGRL